MRGTRHFLTKGIAERRIGLFGGRVGIWRQQVDVSMLSSGLYTLHLRDERGDQGSSRFMVRRAISPPTLARALNTLVERLGAPLVGVRWKGDVPTRSH